MKRIEAGCVALLCSAVALSALRADDVPEELIKKARLNPKHWTHFACVMAPPRRGGDPYEAVAAVWLPEGVKTVRGQFDNAILPEGCSLVWRGTVLCVKTGETKKP